MLYIVFNHPLPSTGVFTMECHVGTAAWKNLSHVARNQEIKYIQADGDELEAIIRAFDVIPMMPTGRVKLWAGDIARSILLNL